MGEKKIIGLFNVIVCTCNGVKVLTLVGTFPLYKLSQKYNEKTIHFYGNYGLAIFENISGQQSGKLKNDFEKLFKKIDYKPLVNVI